MYNSATKSTALAHALDVYLVSGYTGDEEYLISANSAISEHHQKLRTAMSMRLCLIWRGLEIVICMGEFLTSRKRQCILDAERNKLRCPQNKTNC